MRLWVVAVVAAILAAIWWIFGAGGHTGIGSSGPPPKAAEKSSAPSSSVPDEAPLPSTVAREEVPSAPASGQTEQLPSEFVSIATLSDEHKKTLQSFNYILSRDGKAPIPDDAIIRAEDVAVFFREVQKSLDTTDAVHFRFMDAVNTRSRDSVAKLEAALAAGQPPPVEWRLYPAGAAKPPLVNQFDMVSVHARPGDPTQYVLELPETMFPQEVSKYRQARQAQVSLFDGTLRLFFSAPSTQHK